LREIIYEMDRHEMMIGYESSEHDVMRRNNYILAVMYSYLRLKLYNRHRTLFVYLSNTTIWRYKYV